MVRRFFIAGLALGLALLAQTATTVRAASPADNSATAADYNRLAGEVARLQQELREQRQLILQLMEMHSALLRYVQSGGNASLGPNGQPAMPGLQGATPGEKATAIDNRAESQGSGRETSARAASTATVSGSVHVKGGSIGEAFVYLDGPKVLSPHPKAVEIKQDHKQFTPACAVVQVGTRVLFPNEDKVFHNTFSRTPGDAFDLGTLKAGDKPNPVTFMTPGHVEVFCNIHSKMRADIMVVPNGHWVRVRDDGTFQLTGIPLGTRHVILWGPKLKQVSQQLEVTAAGVAASFTTEASTPAPHLNKQGGEYGSYEE
jgi:plastocyanin